MLFFKLTQLLAYIDLGDQSHIFLAFLINLHFKEKKFQELDVIFSAVPIYVLFPRCAFHLLHLR
jgi:hypothetical protein